MTDPPTGDEDDEEARRLVVAIVDFLRDQLILRTDFDPEDRDCLEIAIQSLEMAYGLEGERYVQYRCTRPLLDMFNQVTNPVSVKDKIRADAHKEEGNNYMRRNMYSEAETEYSNAIELDKWNAIYYCNRASARIEQSNFFEAIADCRHALVLNPDYAKAHARLGQAYALLHRPMEAARCYRQALELDPDNERYQNNLRVAESQINRPDAAQLIAGLLGALFGISPQTGEERGTSIFPPSFVIVSESHPPRPVQTPESHLGTTGQASENISEIETEPTETSARGLTEIAEIEFPPTFGILDEGREEQSVANFEPSTENTIPDISDSEEFVIQIPLGFYPTVQSSQFEVGTNSVNSQNTNEGYTEKVQNQINNGQPQHETDVNSNVIEKTDIPTMPTSPENPKSILSPANNYNSNEQKPTEATDVGVDKISSGVQKRGDRENGIVKHSSGTRGNEEHSTDKNTPDITLHGSEASTSNISNNESSKSSKPKESADADKNSQKALEKSDSEKTKVMSGNSEEESNQNEMEKDLD